MEQLKKQILNYFKELNFKEKEHQYLISDVPIKISVSGLIKKYKFPTDWNKVLTNSAKKHRKSEAEISRSWKEAAKEGCETGNEAHLFGEIYVVDRTHKSVSGFDDAIKKFWADLPDYIIPLLLEVRMYHKKYMFAGTADILLYNTKTGQIYIADYKTNKDLFKNYQGQKMTGPFKHLLCSPFNHYKLQLSYYQILLEQIGIKVSGRKLIWLKKDGTYLLYNLEDYSDILRNELETKGI